mgnify:FL=1|jgi:hypothetical protein|tara:strand:+ start:1190 stop:1423 length:234 start_codon:yes stop_codon:yes gene_type:complete
MATVAEASGNGGGRTGSGPENEYSRVSVVASALHGTTVPGYVGQLGTDTTADQNYIGQRADVTSTAALANTDWAKTD